MKDTITLTFKFKVGQKVRVVGWGDYVMYVHTRSYVEFENRSKISYAFGTQPLGCYMGTVSEEAIIAVEED